MSPVAECLLRAADVLERDGWCQLNYENETGQRCMIGALQVAADGDADLLASAKMQVRYQLDDLHLISWNDEQGRRANEVTALLRATAEAVAS